MQTAWAVLTAAISAEARRSESKRYREGSRKMSTVIILLIIILICAYAVFGYVKKLSQGCCGTGGGEIKSEKQPFSTEKFFCKYSVKIEGMSCKNCAAKIENAFNRKEGIFSKADFIKGTAEIFTASPLSEFSIRQTVIGLGYSVKEIKKEK